VTIEGVRRLAAALLEAVAEIDRGAGPMTETPNITHPDVPVPDCGRADDWDPGWKWEEGETRDCRLIYSRERTIDDEARVHV